MIRLLSIVSFAALAIAAPVTAQETEKPEFPSPNAIVDAAPASAWVKIAPSDLLVMDLAPDAEGNPRRVVIQLMPAPFSQGWIRNIRKLATAHWWDGTSINRVQDNYVVQWGDASEKKALPEGLESVPEQQYETIMQPVALIRVPDADVKDREHQRGDGYAAWVRHKKGWPIASGRFSQWPIHCYGAVGVGRNYSPDTGSGAELYTVIGHAPRHLDRNIAVVGRIIEGMEYLSSLPRGKGQLGFYEDASKRVPISSIRLANDLPTADQPRFEYLNTEGESFAQYADARANRRDPFFIKPAGGADICNIPVPVRRVSGK
ncbi:MAG: cyclophilin family peptidyl-prolyl cis-trans isomerase [Parasphingorhabdus sp.]|jgi:cyclophilin family peptidyl-prolyl cis-trans isomerase|uniref:peptidylprolyl isomerase n=1 Tax=Parasphingorhabdus sp. TaxID=2709688 RepID=UPI0039E5D853